MKNKNLPAVIAIFFLILSSIAVLAGIGETVGMLDFGKVYRGGRETFTYRVISSDLTPMPIIGEMQGNLTEIATFKPKRATVSSNSSVLVSVTVRMPKNATPGNLYTGTITFVSDYERPIQGGAVGVGIKTGVTKKARAVASEETAPFPWPLVLVGAILAIVISIIIYQLRGKKK